MKTVKNNSYPTASKILHYIALNHPMITQMSFEVEKSLNKSIYKNKNEVIKPVFISGLARSGSTIITRLLYETEEFCSLTYRNMPFTLMPNIWNKLSGISRNNIDKFERAHKDGIMVDYDSPEEFDEVFWRIYSGPKYIYKNYLTEYRLDEEVIQLYKEYIKGVSQNGNKGRYLSKNNNNIIRLNSIYEALPDSTIIVPFRAPLQHAFSLLKQHRNFCEIARNDPFAVKYMSWLGHYEFGLNQKYFKFPGGIDMPVNKDDINYWLTQWVNVYNFILNNSTQNCIYLCYEKFCEFPKEQLETLFKKVDVNNFNKDAYKNIKLSKNQIDTDITELVTQATKIYSELKNNSI